MLFEATLDEEAVGRLHRGEASPGRKNVTGTFSALVGRLCSGEQRPSKLVKGDFPQPENLPTRLAKQ